MQPNAESLFQAALKLPESERLTLVSRLLESMPDEPRGISLDDADLIAELRQRAGESEGAVPWNQLRTEL